MDCQPQSKDFLSVYQLGTVNTSTARRLTDDEKPTQMARCKVFVVTTLAAQLWVPNKIIFSLWILTTFHLSNIWCQTSDQNQQSLGFTSEGIIPHSLGNGVCVGGCFCTSTLTASLPVGLGVFVPSCVWSLFNCGPVTYLETSPTYYFSCHQQDDLEESRVKKKKKPVLNQISDAWCKCSSLQVLPVLSRVMCSTQCEVNIIQNGSRNLTTDYERL